MNFTDEQIEYIKNANNHAEMLCGGRRNGKTYQLINEMQDKIRNQQFKIGKAIEFIEKYKKQWVENDEVVDDMNNLENILKGE